MTPNNSTCQPAQQQVLKTGTRPAKLRVVTALFCRIDVRIDIWSSDSAEANERSPANRNFTQHL
jgi:hypothetical protein